MRHLPLDFPERYPTLPCATLLAYKEEYPRGLKGNKKILFLGDVLMYLFLPGNLCSGSIGGLLFATVQYQERELGEDRMFEILDIPKGIQPPVARPRLSLKRKRHFLGRLARGYQSSGPSRT